MTAAPQPVAPAAPWTTWSRTFPARRGEVGRARRFLAAILDDCPQAQDAVLCLSELAANAVLHSRSCRPGGQFTVRVGRAPDRLTVEVTDEGGPWLAPGGGCNGRGLAIVEAVAEDLRIGDPGADSLARTVAFDMRLD